MSQAPDITHLPWGLIPPQPEDESTGGLGGQGSPEPPSGSHLGSGSEGGQGARGLGGHHRICRFLHLFRPRPWEQEGLSDLEATRALQVEMGLSLPVVRLHGTEVGPCDLSWKHPKCPLNNE